MKHGSLFSGIGGFDLASEWMGWENIFHCEWNPFGQKVLKHYWPNAISYEDITKTDFTIHRGNIDLLSGGFPCQPYSTAGKRKGKEDERHLWPHMLRAISEIKPTWVVGENVRGLVNWNDGMVFHEVQSDLENQGYEVQPFLIPAAGVNAPSQRFRIWFIAHTNNQGGGHRYSEIQSQDGKISQWHNNAKPSNTGDDNTEFGRFKNKNWEKFPTVTPVCAGNDGIPSGLDGITFPKWRKESIKAGGNAIVPQVALNIFKSIQAYEDIFLPINQNKV
jgi:DNA (cytosine-5)-methyltransferase 1